MLKNLFVILLICITSLANAQTSRQRLEDLEDKLDMMRAEQDYRDAQRRIEQQNRELKDVTPTRPLKKDHYRNTMSQEDRVRLAKFWNLSMSEFLRRDEIGNIECSQYAVEHLCYYSKMLNISFTENEMRMKKAKEKCREIVNSEKKEECMRRIWILNKN